MVQNFPKNFIQFIQNATSRFDIKSSKSSFDFRHILMFGVKINLFNFTMGIRANARVKTALVYSSSCFKREKDSHMRKKSRPCGGRHTRILMISTDFLFDDEGKVFQQIDNENRIALGLFITNFKTLKKERSASTQTIL